MRCAVALLAVSLAACLLAGCQLGDGRPDAGAYMHDGTIFVGDAARCVLGGCIHGGGTDMGPDAEAPPDDGGDDAASPDSGLTCDVPRSGNSIRVAPATLFPVMRAYSFWDATTPCPGTLYVVLADVPACDESGQLFAIGLSRRAIDTGLLVPGPYTVTSGGTPPPFSLTYVRPTALSSPGVSACVASASLSMITFDTLSYSGGTMSIAGSFDVTLTSCTTMSAGFELIGMFDVPVTAPPPVCP